MIIKVFNKLIFEIRMHIMDAQWRNSFLRCGWDMYPPSFYYRHTPEEQKRIMKRDFAELRLMIAELDNG